MPTAEAIARYFLHLAASTEEPSPVTQMQLHKLLYYAQGWCLATRNAPLFRATFQAWRHGPVEVGVYPRFADNGSMPIPAHHALDDPSLSRDDRAMVESIWRGYGKYSTWQLRDMTHRESPWKDARGGVPEESESRTPISEAAIKTYFRSLHESKCLKAGMSAEAFEASLREGREGKTMSFDSLKAEFAPERKPARGTDKRAG